MVSYMDAEIAIGRGVARDVAHSPGRLLGDELLSVVGQAINEDGERVRLEHRLRLDM